MANVLKMATIADIVTLIQAGSSDRRISALLSLDRGTVAKYRRQLQLDKSLTLPAESVHPEDRLGVTTENHAESHPDFHTADTDSSKPEPAFANGKLHLFANSPRARSQKHPKPDAILPWTARLS